MLLPSPSALWESVRCPLPVPLPPQDPPAVSPSPTERMPRVPTAPQWKWASTRPLRGAKLTVREQFKETSRFGMQIEEVAGVLKHDMMRWGIVREHQKSNYLQYQESRRRGSIKRLESAGRAQRVRRTSSSRDNASNILGANKTEKSLTFSSGFMKQ